MKKLLMVAMAMGLGSSIAQTAADGPFGLRMGMTLKEIQAFTKVTELSDFTYEITKPPVANSNFDQYMIIVTPQEGLCKVAADINNIASNDFGDSVKSRFNDLQKSLTSKYGEGVTIDSLKSGSIWKDPRDWMMSLYKRDRTLSTYWIASGTLKLPPYLSAFALRTYGTSSSKAYINIGYEFTNWDKCTVEIAKKGGQGL